MTTEDTKRCAQCGREGTRGFTILPAGEYNGIHFDAVTICTAQKACMRRRPKSHWNEEYA